MSFVYQERSGEGASTRKRHRLNPDMQQNSDSDVAALSDLEEDNGDDDEDDDEDDQEGDEDLPYPGFIPYSMKYLDQKTRPRNWCLAMITNPYPFITVLACLRPRGNHVSGAR